MRKLTVERGAALKTLIRGGRVIDPKSKTDAVKDILIENGKISRIGRGIDAPDSSVIDAMGLVVAPGLVDMHCHLREPGFEYKEDIESGTRSAAMGGFTSVACMPNTKPVADNSEVISYIIKRAKAAGVVNVFPIGAVTLNSEGKELSPIEELISAGAVAVSDDGMPVMNADIMKTAMIKAAKLGIPIISHCEDLNLTAGGVVNEGAVSAALGLPGITPAAEDVMVAREIVLADITGAAVHLAHVSTAGAAALIRFAKRRGIKITCETCPHYFSLDERECESLNTNAKMNPPLRSVTDAESVMFGLIDKTIDVIATDHAPHHVSEKSKSFQAAPNGIIGFETALSVSLTNLYHTKLMSLTDVLACLTYKPASILKLNKGEIKTGADADIVIFDPDAKRTVRERDFLSKAKNSPWIDKELYGAVIATIVAGKPVVLNGKPIV